MSKNIVMCCDGTYDSPTDRTNVYKLFKALAITVGQVAYYDDGVGTDGLPLQRLLGAGMGVGIFNKVKDAYLKIAHVYEPGDKIYLFGFSRGAYTARAVAGMISIIGLPTANMDDQMVGAAFDAYRDPHSLLQVQDKYGMFDAKIQMVGVWDTVGSLGLPAIFGAVDPILCGFLDVNLHRDILSAYHALSLDERRAEFPPTLLRLNDPPVPGQILEQVWFAGVHCDVGGGYPDGELSEIPFRWMVKKAAGMGLLFTTDFLPLEAQFALAPMHESWNLGWGFPKERRTPSGSLICNSVAIREGHDKTYQPRALNWTASFTHPSGATSPATPQFRVEKFVLEPGETNSNQTAE